MFGIVQQVAVYLSASAKRLETFRDVDNASEVDDMPDRHTHRKLSDTRWGSRCDALSTLKAKFYSVVVALDKLGNGTGSDVKAQMLLSLLSVISDSL